MKNGQNKTNNSSDTVNDNDDTDVGKTSNDKNQTVTNGLKKDILNGSICLNQSNETLRELCLKLVSNITSNKFNNKKETTKQKGDKTETTTPKSTQSKDATTAKVNPTKDGAFFQETSKEDDKAIVVCQASDQKGPSFNSQSGKPKLVGKKLQCL